MPAMETFIMDSEKFFLFLFKNLLAMKYSKINGVNINNSTKIQLFF